ncbi:hypothetical protein [Nocardia sp. SC052]|uniref:hypothetical protein n=1 Tax=Nocardia sichangensis TaxID=3385975 RepID=UPI0039A39798
MPGLYDANKGWRIEVREEPAILPHSKAVAVWRGERLDEGAFAVLDATTGKARWSRQRYARWTHWPPTSSSELIREENMGLIGPETWSDGAGRHV